MAHGQRRLVWLLRRELRDTRGTMDPSWQIDVPGVGGVSLTKRRAGDIARDYIARVEGGSSVQNTYWGRQSQQKTLKQLREWLGRHPEFE